MGIGIGRTFICFRGLGPATPSFLCQQPGFRGRRVVHLTAQKQPSLVVLDEQPAGILTSARRSRRTDREPVAIDSAEGLHRRYAAIRRRNQQFQIVAVGIPGNVPFSGGKRLDKHAAFFHGPLCQCVKMIDRAVSIHRRKGVIDAWIVICELGRGFGRNDDNPAIVE